MNNQILDISSKSNAIGSYSSCSNLETMHTTGRPGKLQTFVLRHTALPLSFAPCRYVSVVLYSCIVVAIRKFNRMYGRYNMYISYE